MGKKTRRSLMLCLLCFLIAVPYNVFASTDIVSNDNIVSTQDQTVTNVSASVTNSTAPAAEQTPATDPAVTQPPAVTDQTTSEQQPPADSGFTAPDQTTTSTAPAPDASINTEVVPDLNTPAASQNPVNIQPDNLITEQAVVDPKFADVTFTPQNANVGDTVKIAVKYNLGSYNKDAVEYPYAYIESPTDLNDISIDLRYDEANNQWIGYFTVPAKWEAGYQYVEIETFFNTGLAGYWDYNEIPNAFNIVNNDYTPPQVIKVEASPDPIKAGQTVTFTATIKDVNNQSDIVYAHLFAYNDNYNSEDPEQYIALKYDTAIEKWVGTYSVPADMPDGTEITYSVVAFDKAGNAIDYSNWSDFQWWSVDNTFTVSNDNETLVTTLSTDKSDYTVDNDTNATVKVGAKIVDNGSGVKSVTVSLANNNFSSDQMYHLTTLTYNPTSGLWEGSITLTSSDIQSYYFLYLRGEYNNGSKFNFANASSDFYLTNINSDNTSPSVDNISINPVLPKAGDQVTISATITDNDAVIAKAAAAAVPENRIQSATAYVYYPDYDYEKTVNLSFNTATGNWEGSFNLEVYNQDGFQIYVEALDNSGNYGSSPVWNTFQYDPDWVALWNGDVTQPTLDYYKFPGYTVKLGDTLHFEAGVFDGESGVKSVMATLTNIGSNYETLYWNGDAFDDFDTSAFFNNQYAALALNLTNQGNGVWSTDYKLPLDVLTGLYFVNLIATDNAGNQINYIYNYIYDEDWNEYGFYIPQTMVVLPNDNVAPTNPGTGTVTPGTPSAVVPTPVAAAPVVTTSSAGLPNTGTNNYNLILAGLALLAIGGISFVFRSRKEQ